MHKFNAKLEWISKSKLKVDESYQRPLNEKRVAKMVADFDPRFFGVLSVARRSNGELYLPDTQHRWAAVMQIPEIDEVPCVVFESAGPSEEARVFLGANAAVAVNTLAKHHARVTAEEPWAILAEELVTSVGRRFAANSSTPQSVGFLDSIARAAGENEEALRRVWPVYAKWHAGAPMRSEVFNGLFYIECWNKRAVSLSGEDWSERLCSLDITAVRNRISNAKKRTARVAADVILGMLNEGVARTSQLKLPKPRDVAERRKLATRKANKPIEELAQSSHEELSELIEANVAVGT